MGLTSWACHVRPAFWAAYPALGEWLVQNEKHNYKADSKVDDDIYA